MSQFASESLFRVSAIAAARPIEQDTKKMLLTASAPRFFGFSGFGVPTGHAKGGAFSARFIMEDRCNNDYYDESNTNPVDWCAGSNNRGLFNH
jgi:hypothetical protein